MRHALTTSGPWEFQSVAHKSKLAGGKAEGGAGARCWWIAVAGALALAMLGSPVYAGAPEKAAAAYEKWYVLQMNDERAGHAVERQSTDADGNFTTISEMTFRLQRLGQEIKILISTEYIETPDGSLVSMTTSQDLGLTSMQESYRFTEDGVTQESVTGDRITRKNHPLPEGEWLSPAKARMFIESRIAAGEKEFSYRVLEPSMGLTPVEHTHTIKGPVNVEVFGKTIPAIEWQITQSALPGVRSTEYVDRRGVTVRSEVNLGGIKMVMLEAERDLALSNFSAPEMMAGTLVRPSRPIDDPRDTKRAMYVLSLIDGEPMPDLPTVAAQRVERIDANRVRVTVNVDYTPVAPAHEVADRRYIDPSTAADAADPAIINLAKRALEGVPADPAKRAEALRIFTHYYIDQKSLGVGFATASEVCATREGDCSEHGVLLAALLRADGIPSRVVSGVVYVDSFVGERQVFGFHMWTQALITHAGRPRWIDLDATMPDTVTFDATHIALSTSSLADGDIVNSMAALVGLLGNLKIDVERTEK